MTERDVEPPNADADAETDALRRRYARRAPDDERYSLLDAAALRERQGRQRALARLLKSRGGRPAALSLVEVGCGDGTNLLECLLLGFAPAQLLGIELLPERQRAARERLPAATEVWLGDACAAPVADASRDLVLAATVFSSLLDDAFQQRLADAMWRWLRPGGAVLWYDFTVDNPRNRDVRGVPLRRVRELFPQGRIAAQRLTLAPPLARALGRLHPALVAAADALLPPLRTHVLACITKPEPSP